nr:MAG TPA: hypothetical protein [Caudoviricetes sp.]
MSKTLKNRQIIILKFMLRILQNNNLCQFRNIYTNERM